MLSETFPFVNRWGCLFEAAAERRALPLCLWMGRRGDSPRVNPRTPYRVVEEGKQDYSQRQLLINLNAPTASRDDAGQSYDKGQGGSWIGESIVPPLRPRRRCDQSTADVTSDIVPSTRWETDAHQPAEMCQLTGSRAQIPVWRRMKKKLRILSMKGTGAALYGWACICTVSSPEVLTHTHTHAHARTHARTHTCTRTRTHTHTLFSLG